MIEENRYVSVLVGKKLEKEEKNLSFFPYRTIFRSISYFQQNIFFFFFQNQNKNNFFWINEMIKKPHYFSSGCLSNVYSTYASAEIETRFSQKPKSSNKS